MLEAPATKPVKQKQRRPVAVEAQTACLTCPTCRRPFEEEKKQKPQVIAAPPVVVAPPAVAAEIKVPDWPCPFLSPELLLPVKKYPRKFYPFTSGQNASSPTKFQVIPNAVEPTKKQKKQSDSEDEYDECTED